LRGAAIEDLIILIFSLSVLVVYGFCCYRLAQRLGYDGMLGILLIVPVLNVVIMFIAAVNESPNEQKIATLERRLVRAKSRAAEEDVIETDEEVEALAQLGA